MTPSISIPFSIEPDAEDYIRTGVTGRPRGTMPVIVMTSFQSDGLKPPHWFYEGESFVIDHFNPNGKAQEEFAEFKLFGHAIAIEPDALKHLTGQVLRLRRVDSRLGIMNVPRYVLVAESADAQPATDSGSIANYLPVAGLTLLGGFTGIGIAWIIYGTISVILKIPWERFYSSWLVWMIFTTGWILGAIASFFFSRFVFKRGGRTQYSRDKRQIKYLGSRPEVELAGWIFFGVPVSLMAVAVLIIGRFAHTDEQKIYGSIVTLMVVFGGALYFCDKMPRRLVFWLGIFGWLLALAIGCWYFSVHGP